MKVTIDAKHVVMMGRGMFTTGDEVDLRLKDVQPLIDRDLAHEGWDSEKKPKRTRKKAVAKKSGEE